MPRIKGDQLIVLINGSLLPCATSYNFNMSIAEVEVNNSVSGVWGDFEPERIVWSLSGDYIYETDNDNFATVFTLAATRQTVDVQIKHVDDEGFYYNGEGFINLINHVAALGEAAGFTVTLRGKGELSQEFFVNFWIDENLDFITDENDDFIVF